MRDAGNSALYQLVDNLIVIAKNRSLGNIAGEKCGYSNDFNAFLNKYFGVNSGNKIVKQ